MSRLIVDAAFGYSITAASPVWTNITEFVDIATGISIDRGASDEVSDIQPGTCTFRLNNEDGRFTPGNGSSPYSPNVRKHTPLRVRVVTAVKNLLTNPSFESGLTGWIKSNSPTTAVSTVRAVHGAQSLLMTFGGSGASGQYTGVDVEGLTVGQVYTWSASVYVPVGHTRVAVAGQGVPGPLSTLYDAWERLSVTFTATTTTHRMWVISDGVPVGGHQVWIDAAQFEEGSSATAFDPEAAQIHPRFYGMVGEWPLTWDGLHATTTIVATDLFKWLARLPALQPMLVTEMIGHRPYAYYPMGEDSQSATLGDVSGNGCGALSIRQTGSGGTLAFGDGGGPVDGLGCPVFTPASTTAGKYLRADLGTAFTTAAHAAGQNLIIETWFSTTANDRYLLSLSSLNGEYQQAVSLQSGSGYLKMNRVQAGEHVLGGAVVYSVNLADGALHHLLINIATREVFVDGVSVGTSSHIQAPWQPASLYLGAWADSSKIDGQAALWSGTIAQTAIYVSSTVPVADLLTHRTTGTTAYIGEPADTRLSRLAAYIGLTMSFEGSTFDGMASQAALGRSPLDHMRDIERTESARLFASRAAKTLVFQSRDVRYSPTALLTLDYADLETGAVDLADDDQKMVNTVEASRPGGARQRIVDNAARDLYGPYEQQIDLIKADDDAVLDAGNWLVSRYADPPPELRQVPVEAYSLPLASYRALLAADISSTLTISGLPAQAPAPSATVAVEGYRETISHHRHLIDFHTSRAAAGTVWILDDPSYSVLGTSTRLAY